MKNNILCIIIFIGFSVFIIDWFREKNQFPTIVETSNEIKLPKLSPISVPLEYLFPLHHDDFKWDGKEGDLSSPFGERISPFRERMGGSLGFHTGVDLWGVSHVGVWQARVVAAADGVILNHWFNHPIYGKMIEILHEDGSITRYAHLSVSYIHEKRVVSGKLVPWEVKRGDVIGRIGDSGYSQGTHLHFELEIDGRVVNPLKYIDIPLSSK
jgi:murein DD-endopeptidase MepM/ murein hydrolase activator NlpD